MTTMIRRKKKSAKSKYSDEAFIGLEPEWKDADKWTGEKYYRERSRVAYYYSYYFYYSGGGLGEEPGRIGGFSKLLGSICVYISRGFVVFCC